MENVKIKLLSSNNAWKGRRYKTEDYIIFERDLFFLLPKIKVPEGKIKLYMMAGFSSTLADLDNISKQTIDIMQKRYKFNDKMIFKLILEKEIVDKGSEYLMFKFFTYRRLSKCCKADMFDGGQCTVCGADGRGFFNNG